jgi:putative endonuclease
MSNNKPVLYVGMTNNLERRVWEHKTGHFQSSFTDYYKCQKLLYYETFAQAQDASNREKNLKNWQREWKMDLIKKENSQLNDISKDWE